jgi:universal stress protein A
MKIPMSDTIIHPTDFSKPSEAALRFASSLARELGYRLLIVHVAPPLEATMIADGGMEPYPVAAVPNVDTLAARNDALREQLASVEPTAAVDFERRLLEGDPVNETVKLAKECGARQIVMGSHGRKGFTRMLMGSVAESIIRQSPCPVTVVKANTE